MLEAVLLTIVYVRKGKTVLTGFHVVFSDGSLCKYKTNKQKKDDSIHEVLLSWMLVFCVSPSQMTEHLKDNFLIDLFMIQDSKTLGTFWRKVIWLFGNFISRNLWPMKRAHKP